jgi:sulfofructose kinase
MPASARPAHVLSVGSANIDHVFEMPDLPSGEGKVTARAAHWGGGGNAATAAVAVSQLGARATWCGLIGDDWLGQMLKKLFDGAGVQLAAKAIVPGAVTPVATVLVDGTGRRWLGYYPGEGLDLESSPPQLPDMRTVDAVMATRSDARIFADAMNAAAARGLPRVLDAESGTADRLTGPALLVDHVVFSELGLAEYTGIADVDAALMLAAERLPYRTVGATLGPRGSAWYRPEGALWFPAPAVTARDTTGCGDVFHGAYALAVAEGLDLCGAIRFATAAAALKAERGNSWEGMPDRGDVDRLTEKGWT